MAGTKRTTRSGKTKKLTIICDQKGNVNIPSFPSISVSTMTIIGVSNLVINTDKFYRYIPVTDYVVVKKKRGRKKKIQPEDPNKDVPPGSIITVEKKRSIRGVILKQKKKKSKTYFRHSVSVVMVLDNGKLLNVKVSRNGKLQMTGCQNKKHQIDFVKYLYTRMIEAEEWTGETIFTFKDANTAKLLEDTDDEEIPEKVETETGLSVIYKTVMMNIDFDIGYKVRRDKLNKYINRFTEYVSIFESSIGTSVNIKVKSTKPFDPYLARLMITADGDCIEDYVSYESYFSMLTDKDRNEEKKKKNFHTFLVFASGKIIMSSQGPEMKTIFYELIDKLVKHRTVFEEQFEENPELDMKWLDMGENIDNSFAETVVIR